MASLISASSQAHQAFSFFPLFFLLLLGWRLKNRHPQNIYPFLLHDSPSKSGRCCPPALLKQHLPSLSRSPASISYGWFPCPMDDKCDGSFQKQSITASRHWSKLSYKQRQQHTAEPPRSGAGGVRGGRRAGGGPPACPVPGEPSCLAQKTHNPAPLPDSKV